MIFAKMERPYLKSELANQKGGKTQKQEPEKRLIIQVRYKSPSVTWKSPIAVKIYFCS